jgi:hypothetical protein
MTKEFFDSYSVYELEDNFKVTYSLIACDIATTPEEKEKFGSDISKDRMSVLVEMEEGVFYSKPTLEIVLREFKERGSAILWHDKDGKIKGYK